MSSVSSTSNSALYAIQSGFSRLNQAANEITSAVSQDPTLNDPTEPTVNADGSPDPGADPLITGVGDMMLARVQVEAGTALLHEYDKETGQLFDMFA